MQGRVPYPFRRLETPPLLLPLEQCGQCWSAGSAQSCGAGWVGCQKLVLSFLPPLPLGGGKGEQRTMGYWGSSGPQEKCITFQADVKKLLSRENFLVGSALTFSWKSQLPSDKNPLLLAQTVMPVCSQNVSVWACKPSVALLTRSKCYTKVLVWNRFLSVMLCFIVPHVMPV